jgi:signal transduction histidine kinase
VKTLRPALWGLAGAGLVFGVIDAALIAASDFVDWRGFWIAVTLVLGWSFIFVGLYAWGRRPDNRVGMLMVAVGFAWFVGQMTMSNVPLLFTFGGVLGALFIVCAIHLLLAFPSGHLQSRFDRNLLIAGYLDVTLGPLALYVWAGPKEIDCSGCPDNLILITPSQTMTTIVGLTINVIALVLMGMVLYSLVRRWRGASVPQRRLLVPVYAAGCALLVAMLLTVFLQSLGVNGTAEDVIWGVGLLPFMLIPYLFLGTLIQTRMIQGGRIGELIAELGQAPQPGELRDALARALRDPSLELVYWLPDSGRYVDASGRAVLAPPPDGDRAMTPVERDGQRVAGIVHDAALLEDPEHVRAVGAAAALALENERLDAELRARFEELRAARTRMVRAAVEERRRLERNLHDGAQQRLVSLALNLRLARARLREDPDAADQLLIDAGAELDAALAELRELARGIHPALLSERGLDAALAALADRAPIEVELAGAPGERLPEQVELAAYFVVSEALANIAKYAKATHASVRVERVNGHVEVEVTDDGVGGADPTRGTGLQGLRDRVCGVDGTFAVDSAPGVGTTVRAEIPCG